MTLNKEAKDIVSFIVAGAQKSGTTAMDAYLRSHPDIQMASVKETHFFDNEANFLTDCVEYDKYHSYFSSADHDRLWGEVTPIYMYWHTAPQRIFNYNPKMKWIMILRNPIERAFSQWAMQANRKLDSLSFSTAICTEKARCQKSLPLQNRVHSYVDRGFYTKQLQNIWQFFPRNNTLIIKYEDFKYDIDHTMRQISQFLNVSPFLHLQYREEHVTRYTMEIPVADHAFLQDVYTDEIKQLEFILQWDCSDWLQFPRK